MLANPRSPTLVLPQLIFSPYSHLPIVCSPLTLLTAKVLSKSPLQSHSAMSFAASTTLWPPRRANSTEAPLVSKTAVYFGNPYIHLPSFLPSFLLSFLPPSPSLVPHQPLLPPISLTENKLTRTKRLQTWVGAGDNMKNIAYHEKLILKGPGGLIVRPTSIKPTLLVLLRLLLLLPFNGFPPPSQFGTSHAEVIVEVFLSFFF